MKEHSVPVLYDYDWLMSELMRLSNCYHSDVLQQFSCGESVQGRSIPVVRIGSGPKRLHVNASVHANEWITTPLILRFIEEMAESANNACSLSRGYDLKRLLEETSVWFVPMVNPDGVQLVHHGISPADPLNGSILQWNGGSADFSNWKANIRGVDLNDQFPANWDKELERRAVAGPSSRDYPGRGPLTEPEAVALYRLTIDVDFHLVISLHTQGREIYWNYREFEPAYANQLADQLGAVSGYTPVKLGDSDAGFKDWFIYTYRRPGFTIEAGWGCNPLPLEQLPVMYNEVAPLLLEAMDFAAFHMK